MTQQHDIKTFKDLSEKYSTWIIKYCTTTFGHPLFLVWYTDNDEDGTTKLLTHKSGEIFSVNSLTNFKTTVISEIKDLILCDNITSWLDNFGNLEVTESCTYDVATLENEIDKNNLDILTLENFTNFVNLFDDFINQDVKYADLKIYANNELIKETWNYYYEYIFWPKFNDKEKFEAWDRPQLVIDSKELLVKLKDIIKVFDDNIKLTEKAIC